MMNPVEKIDRLWDSLRDTSRKRLLMTAAFMLIMVVIILGILFFGNLADLPQEGMDNLYILLSSSVIALVGVSVTGYIFLTESLRNIKESRPRFYSAADRYQRNVFKRLVRIFAIGIILVIVYAMMAYYLDTMDFLFNDVNVRTWMMLTGVISFIAFLALSVHYDLRMMDINEGISTEAERLLLMNYVNFKRMPLVVRLNPEEFRALTMPDSAGRREFVPVHLHDGVDYEGLIYGIRGKDSNRIDCGIQNMDDVIHDIEKNGPQSVTIERKVLDEYLKVAYRDMVDEFESNRVISVFDDIERILCRMAGINSETLDYTDRKKLESIFGVGGGRMSETGIANDILDYYFQLKSYRDNYFVISAENGSDDGKQTDVAPWIDLVTLKPDQCLDRLFVDICNDESDDNGQEKKDGKDRKIKRKKGPSMSEHLREMTPFVYLLRYELSKKLTTEDLSNMHLPMYDFSYGNLEKSTLRGSQLTGASFYRANLTDADLSDCDLTGSDFKHACATGAMMTGSKISNASFEGCICDGTGFNRGSLTNCRFPKTPMAGMTLEDSSVVLGVFTDCNCAGSNFVNASLIKSVMDECICINSNLSGSTMSDCTITNSNFTGCTFTNATMNNTSLKYSLFITTKIENAEMTSNFLLDCDFSSSQMKRVNFTGSQILAASFESAQLAKSDFTRSFIGSYRLDSRLSEWVTKDEDVLRTYEMSRRELVSNRDPVSGPDSDIIKMRNEISVFDHAFMMECLFIEAEITDVSMRYVLLNRSTFNKVYLANTTLENASLSEVYMADMDVDGCNLNNTSFNNASITAVRFINCFMRDAAFGGTVFTNTEFVKCNLSESSFNGASIIGSVLKESTGLNAGLFQGCKGMNITLEKCRTADGRTISGTFLDIDELTAKLG